LHREHTNQKRNDAANAPAGMGIMSPRKLLLLNSDEAGAGRSEVRSHPSKVPALMVSNKHKNSCVFRMQKLASNEALFCCECQRQQRFLFDLMSF
jgi:hypothetical protein